MGFFAFLLLGLIAGIVARAIVPGKINDGLFSALVCGVVGAMVGGWLATALFHVGLGTFWSLRTWVIAILGSIIVLVIWGAIKGRRH